MTQLSKWKMACIASMLCAATATTARAQTFTKLLDFERTNGGAPWYMSFAQGIDGKFYGTTEHGGAGGCFGYGCGTVFRITPEGALAGLHLMPADGTQPIAGLLLAVDGNFYGTAGSGGAYQGGTVFEISKTGKLTVLYNFCAQADCADGAGPDGKLTQGTDGNFYGTTAGGGANFCPSRGTGCGTVFRSTPAGTLTTLYSFCNQPNCADGALPYAGLVQGTDGRFYGTTASISGSDNVGTVFKITAAGTLTTLHKFEGPDGALPAAWLVQGTDGNFYGTTVEGGSTNGGTVFRITATGEFATLYSFCIQPNCTDGVSPYTGLIQGSDGNYYGITTGGGGAGTAYQITAGGALTTLHTFEGTDGYLPLGGLMQGTNGFFYGTTAYGGDPSCNKGFGCGTVFSLDIGLGQFVTFIRAAGKVGQTCPILGQGFTGTTSVTLNGTPASFTVVSDTYIRATVPAGATTGYVTVTTPSGTLTSNVPFHVIR